MRGRVNGRYQADHGDGITPAYAGKRTARACAAAPSEDHPRVCGEEVICAVVSFTCVGSPPRMRGRVNGRYQADHGDGITPAYAGKRTARACAAAPSEDHPRVCGEEVICAVVSFTCVGSPPRMRGREHRQRQTVWKDGITPAYAGKRVGIYTATRGDRDHPRVCGEEALMPENRAIVQGSPPRMRGRVPYVPVAAIAQGITPAYAGKRA